MQLTSVSVIDRAGQCLMAAFRPLDSLHVRH